MVIVRVPSTAGEVPILFDSKPNYKSNFENNLLYKITARLVGANNIFFVCNLLPGLLLLLLLLQIFLQQLKK